MFGVKIPPPIYTGVEMICVLLLHQSGGLPSLSDEKREEEEGKGEGRAFPHYRNKSGSWLAPDSYVDLGLAAAFEHRT